MSTTILDSVRSFVVETFYAPADLADDASLLDTGTIDSTGVLELIVFLEKRWAITVGDREIHPDYFDSVRRITTFVERKLAERAEVSPAVARACELSSPPSPPPISSPPLGSHP
jgi:acyl carrier protein